MSIRSQSILFTLTLFSLVLTSTAFSYTPKAEKVTDNVYAFIGPLGQRSEANDGR